MVGRLAARGLRILLLSGDRPGTVAAVAARAGIATWRAGLTPAAKHDEIVRLTRSGARVLMVGDGLNDGPALAAAHASISPSNAADLCQVTADVVFQGDSLAPVPDVIALARTTRAVVRENIGLALLYNLCAVPVAMAGFVTPLLAALAMSSSSLIVVGNAMRLARRRS
jgi:Cu2+-exporting ATPase